MAFDVFDCAGLAQQIQNHKRAEDHQDNLETFLQALPDERVIRRDVFLERCAGDVKIRKGENQRPDQGNRGNLFCRLVKRQNADQNDDDWTECHHKV